MSGDVSTELQALADSIESGDGWPLGRVGTIEMLRHAALRLDIAAAFIRRAKEMNTTIEGDGLIIVDRGLLNALADVTPDRTENDVTDQTECKWCRGTGDSNPDRLERDQVRLVVTGSCDAVRAFLNSKSGGGVRPPRGPR